MWIEKGESSERNRQFLGLESSGGLILMLTPILELPHSTKQFSQHQLGV